MWHITWYHVSVKDNGCDLTRYDITCKRYNTGVRYNAAVSSRKSIHYITPMICCAVIRDITSIKRDVLRSMSHMWCYTRDGSGVMLHEWYYTRYVMGVLDHGRVLPRGQRLYNGSVTSRKFPWYPGGLWSVMCRWRVRWSVKWWELRKKPL